MCLQLLFRLKSFKACYKGNMPWVLGKAGGNELQATVGKQEMAILIKMVQVSS